MKLTTAIAIAALCVGVAAHADDTTSKKSLVTVHVDHDAQADSCKAKNHFSLFLGGFYYGWGGASSHSPYNGTMSVTQEVGIQNVIGLSCSFGPSRRNNLSLGVGYQAKWYNTKSKYTFDGDADGNLTIVPFDSQYRHTASALTVHTIQFPLLYEFCFGRNGKAGVWAGAALDWNCYASYGSNYKIDRTEYTTDTDGIHQRKLSYDLLAGVHWRALGVYFRYTPQSVLKDGTGPKLDNRWSIGLMLGL